MKTEYDEIPVRLPSGTKAVLVLPRPFTIADARHLVKWVGSYVEDKALKDTSRDSADSATERKS